jgi:hypothetical protein
MAAVDIRQSGIAEVTEWVAAVKSRLPAFLTQMRGKQQPGFYRYSYSGDRYGEESRWGLGNTAFAAKCWYALGAMDQLDSDHRHAMVSYIRSFQRDDGLIYDAFLRRRAWASDLALTVMRRRLRDSPRRQVCRAETRQAYSALKLLGERVTTPVLPFMKDRGRVDSFVRGLDWSKPWSAGSHLSHLLFFLAHSDHPDRAALIEHVLARVRELQQHDGAWYVGAPDLAQKINGAMKVITGLKVIGRTSFDRSRPLIDMCLAASQDRQACDNFNVVYVLKYAGDMAPGYRREEIRRFGLDRLKLYRRHYHPLQGGFSFWEGAAGRDYYGAHVSAGRNEPDLHGTTLFLWGMSVITQVLGLENAVQLNEFDA